MTERRPREDREKNDEIVQKLWIYILLALVCVACEDATLTEDYSGGGGYNYGSMSVYEYPSNKQVYSIKPTTLLGTDYYDIYEYPSYKHAYRAEHTTLLGHAKYGNEWNEYAKYGK